MDMDKLLNYNDIDKVLKVPTHDYITSKIELSRNYQNADYQYEILLSEIKAFEENLDDEHEVAIKLASFGESITINVEHIGYYNPSIIVFDGTINGNKATLMQHINQLNFLLLAVRKADPELPPRRIGFDLEQNGG